MRTCWVLLGGLLGVLGGEPAEGAAIFDNLGPEDDYQRHVGWTVSGRDSPIRAGWEAAMAFTPTGTDYRLDEIQVALNPAGPDHPHGSAAPEIQLSLMTSREGQPGDILESWPLVDLLEPPGPRVLLPPIRASSTAHPRLSDGSQYWVVVAGGKSTWAAWNWNAMADQGPQASHLEGQPWVVNWADRGAFRVTGTPVSDPGVPPFLLFGVGVWMLMGHQSSVEEGIYRTPEASVTTPEASPYALFGLGALGLLVWRRGKAR